MASQEFKNRLFLSFPRKRESSLAKVFWTPARAGVTTWGTSYEFINLALAKFCADLIGQMVVQLPPQVILTDDRAASIS